ncbi:MAG: peptidoglycan-binding protein, partial [Clostridiaceae bacterium]|nr:peptidoglycan-binding protein [Clostridiaceae bacterium]
MSRKKNVLIAAALSFLVVVSPLCTISASAAQVLKEGMSGSEVSSLQKDLRTLGYLSVSPTGYYGSLTTAAVKKLQGNNGLHQDGVAGDNTFKLVKRLVEQKSQSLSSRSVSSSVLKEGMSGSEVSSLQKDLKALGYLSVNPTGYYGSLTKSAVKKLQKKYGLSDDGIAGGKTASLIDRLMGRTSSRSADVTTAAAASTVSASSSKSSQNGNYLVAWFGGVENSFGKGDTAQVYDIRSGRTFNIKRTYGYNHADCETLTAKDTKIMLEIYGGEWSWERRPIIITTNGKKYAASMAGMPHAGVDSASANTYVKSRSGGYGGGS